MKIYKYYKQTWHRILLEKHLLSIAPSLSGKILDIGSKNRRYDHLFPGKVTAIDKTPNKDMDVCAGNIEKGLTFPNSEFDHIICLEVIEYIKNHKLALSEIRRLLKPGGIAIISAPFMYHDHGDYHRLTASYWQEILSPHFQSVTVTLIGNGFIVIWDIIRKKTLTSSSGLTRKIIFLFILPILLIIKILRLAKVHDSYYSGVFIKLKK